MFIPISCCMFCLLISFQIVGPKRLSPIKAKIGDFPAIVLVVHISEVPLCGGALIEIRHVVTSALCVSKFLSAKEIEEVNILAGEVLDGDLYGPTRQVRPVTHIMTHETEDISVLRIASLFARSIFLEPIPMATFDVEIGSKCVLVSWSQEPSKPGDYQLFSLLVNIRNPKTCHIKNELMYCVKIGYKLNFYFGEIGSSLICNKILYGVYTEPEAITYRRPAKFASMYNLREWIINALLWNGSGLIPRPYYRKVSQISRSVKNSINGCFLYISFFYITHLI